LPIVQCATGRDVQRTGGKLECALVAERGDESLVERGDLGRRTSRGDDAAERVDEQAHVRRALTAQPLGDVTSILEEVDRFLILELRRQPTGSVDSFGVLLHGDADDARQSPRGMFLRGERRGREGEA
jgi:hypothetical protein